MGEKHALPRGWHKEFLKEADLERSFRALEGSTHFFAEAMRGRIRSLQLRHGAASGHFERADEIASAAPESIANLLHRLVLAIYEFDNALMEESVGGEPAIQRVSIPELPEEIKREYPEVPYAIALRAHAEAVLELHLGNLGAALAGFRRLIEAEERPVTIENVWRYLGLAAAQEALGWEKEALRNLENAGLVVQSTGETLNRAHAAAQLHAFYSFLKQRALGAEWLAFLEQLPCPRETKALFKRRAARILARSSEAGRLLVL